MPAALVLGLLLALGACHPAYDWREIQETEAGYRILLPARPVSMSRPIDLDGVAVTMSMTGARVDEALFTVGSVALPSASEPAREHATQAMRTAMERNVQGHETKATQIEVPLIDAAGRVAGEPSHMSAPFVARGDRAWQGVMIAPASDPQAARLFHESFRIAQ